MTGLFLKLLIKLHKVPPRLSQVKDIEFDIEKSTQIPKKKIDIPIKKKLG